MRYGDRAKAFLVKEFVRSFFFIPIFTLIANSHPQLTLAKISPTGTSKFFNFLVILNRVSP